MRTPQKSSHKHHQSSLRGWNERPTRHGKALGFPMTSPGGCLSSHLARSWLSSIRSWVTEGMNDPGILWYLSSFATLLPLGDSWNSLCYLILFLGIMYFKEGTALPKVWWAWGSGRMGLGCSRRKGRARVGMLSDPRAGCVVRAHTHYCLPFHRRIPPLFSQLIPTPTWRFSKRDNQNNPYMS